MSGRKQPVPLIALVATLCGAAATTSTIGLLSQTAMREEAARLREIAQSQARLIESVARHEAAELAGASAEAREALVLAQVRDANQRFRRAGRSMEVNVGRREGDSIAFLLSERGDATAAPESVHWDSPLAAPMRAALSLGSGTLTGPDYRGRQVLAAYEPVEGLGWGVVAKIETSEVRRPFIAAGAWAVAVTALLVVSGAMAIRRILAPTLRGLRESEERYRHLFDGAVDAIAAADPETGVLVDCNAALEELAGRPRAELIGQHQSVLHPPSEPRGERHTLGFELRAAGDPGAPPTSRVIRPDGSVREVEVRSSLISASGRALVQGIFRDVTDRRNAEQRQRLTADVLATLNLATDETNILRDILLLIKDAAGVDSAGLRLRDGNDYPYSVVNGFSGEFVQLETKLCNYDESGSIVCDATGSPVLDCMCGNVIQGRTDPSQPFFTEGGSFWSNGTTALLASTTEEERQARTRNRCNGEGYESVALIPVRDRDSVLGVLQLNDHRPGAFTLGMIEFLEELTGSIGIAIQRKRATQALRESEERYRQIVEASLEGIWAMDGEYRTTFVNPRMAAMLGCSQADMLGRPVTDFMFEDDLPAHAARMAERRGGAPGSYQRRFRRADGSEVWCAVSSVARIGDEGAFLGSFGMFADITEQRRATEQLRLQAMVLDQIRDHVTVTDLEGTIRYVNQAQVAGLGYAREDLIGQSVALFGEDPEQGATQPEIIERTLRDGEWSGRVVNTTADGREVVMLARTTVVRDAQGTPIALSGVASDVTEQVRAEQELRDSRDHYSALFERGVPTWVEDFSEVAVHFERLRGSGVTDLGAHLDAHPSELERLARGVKVLEVNAESLALMGASSRDELIVGLARFFPPDAWPVFRAEMIALFGGRPRFHSEIPILTVAGERRIVDLTVSVVPGHESDLSRVLAWFRDVTEREQAAASLRESETRFRELFDWMPAAAVIYEPVDDGADFVIADLNAECEQVESVRKQDLLGRRLTEVFPGVEEMGLLSTLRRVYRTGQPELDPARYYHDGRIEGWRENRVYRLPAGQVVAVYEDRTAQKRAEESARASAEGLSDANQRLAHAIALLEVFLSSAPIGIAFFDAAGRFLRLNALLSEAVGVTQEAAAGKTLGEALPGFSAAVESCVERVRATGEAILDVRHEKATVGDPGDVRQWQASYYPVTLPSGEPAGVGAILLDVTDQVRAAEERSRLESQVQRGQRLESIGVMAGGIAHDFNNVLAGIMGFAEMATEELPPGSTAAHHLEHVLEGSARARDLVQQILTFCRQTPMERRPMLLHLVVNEALGFLRASLPATVEIERDVSRETGPVLADATQIHQVIVNLCTNAEYAMRPGGGTLHVSLTTEDVDERRAEALGGIEAGRYAVLSIRDTGCGMDAATLERIFDPFFTTKPTGEGSGLGLATTYGIVTGHGGAITAYSEVGRGTSFRVYLPCVPALTAEPAPEVARAPHGSERLLFVDDEPLLVSMARGMLTSLGYVVTAVTSSEEALAAIRARPEGLDLLVTDLTMPGMTGLDLAEEARAIRPDLPVLLMTGFRQNVDAERAEAAGIAGIVDKPYGKQALGEAVRMALDGASGASPA